MSNDRPATELEIERAEADLRTMRGREEKAINDRKASSTWLAGLTAQGWILVKFRGEHIILPLSRRATSFKTDGDLHITIAAGKGESWTFYTECDGRSRETNVYLTKVELTWTNRDFTVGGEEVFIATTFKRQHLIDFYPQKPEDPDDPPTYDGEVEVLPHQDPDNLGPSDGEFQAPMS